MKMSVKTMVLASALSLAAIAGMAQTRGPMEEHHGMPMGERHGMSAERMGKMVARHLEELKSRLKITAAQEGAWKTFADAMKPTGDMMGKRPDFAALKDLPTPERLDKMRALHKQMEAERDAAMEQRDGAIKTFYAGLTPEQKKAFDAEFSRMGDPGHGARASRKGPQDKPAAPAKK